MPLTFQGISDAVNLYRDTDTGDILPSSDVIDTALGNPLTPGDINPEGHTLKELAGIDEGGLYQTTMTTRKYIVNEGTSFESEVGGEEAPPSKFNDWNLLRYKSLALANQEGNSVNLEDYKTTIVQEGHIALNPTARTIVEETSKNGSLGYSYKLEDFVQCEYYGTVPNNYMLTLRRFSYPIGDDILSPGEIDDNGVRQDTQQPDIARAVTWMSTTLGNPLNEIIKFNVGFNWKEEEAKVQDIDQGNQSRGKMGNRIDSSPLLSAIEEGLAGRTAAQTDKIKKGQGHDPLRETYPNAIYGPINVIDKMLVRDRGLTFEQEFTLKFHYDLKGYGNTSPRVAFMDTLSNLLILTYNDAPFWGGAARYFGRIKKPFGNFNLLANGDYKGYLGSIGDQFASATSNLVKDLKNGVNGIMEKGINGLADSKILDQIAGGALIELFGSGQNNQAVQAFLTGDPTGQWHLTVGNPLNPVMVIGNLCLQKADFNFSGPLGYEDFPSKLTLTVTLKPGRPRDKQDIESMFNAGKGRIYLQPEGTGKIQFQEVNQYGQKYGKINTNMARNISDMAQG